MGNLYLTARAALEAIGLTVVVPPPITRYTISLGTRNSPEFACLPLKVNLGNYLEARELGADTVIMAGGVGPCRFGYYAQVQREILRDLGCAMEMVVLEPPDVSVKEVLDKIKALNSRPWPEGVKGLLLAWQKTRAADLLEQEAQRVRAKEAEPGRADTLYSRALTEIDRAAEVREVKGIADLYQYQIRSLPIDPRRALEVVRIAIVGEIYTILEPAVNLNVERNLGRMGAEVTRSIYLSQWINDHLLGGLLPLPGSKEVRQRAAPYLPHFVGGHGRETVGGTVEYARRGFDGVIQIAPLTCMPEIVAQSILPRVSREEQIPVMTLYVDEQTGEAGQVTRLEAFVDMLRRKKAQKAAIGL